MAYRARLDDDGFYSISGVPVFAEVPKGSKDAPFDIDKEWLDAALANAKQRAKEGYLPPIHFEHHGENASAFKAGHYKLARVSQIRVGGMRKWALLADFTKLPRHVFDAILGNEWPYRSVEIASYEEREIESLALLSDCPPFHKFALLNADTIDVDPAPGKLLPAGPVAFAKRDHGYAGLFCFTEDRMEFTLSGDPDAGFSLLDDKGKPAAEFVGATFALDTGDGFGLVSFGEDGDDDDLPDDVKKLKALMARCKAKMARMQDDDEQHTPADVGKDDDDDKGTKASASILAKFDDVSARLAAIESEKVVDRMLTDGIAGLEAKGYHVSTETREVAARFAARGKEPFADFIGHYERSVPRDGPETIDEGEEPELVARFRNAGPEAHEKAAEFNSRFDELVAAGLRNDTDPERKRFVEFSLRTAGIKVAV